MNKSGPPASCDIESNTLIQYVSYLNCYAGYTIYYLDTSFYDSYTDFFELLR